MKITPTHNHGKPRWRVNIQRGSYRKRLFFASREEAQAFAEATGGSINYTARGPRPVAAPPAPRPAVVTVQGARQPARRDSWGFFQP